MYSHSGWLVDDEQGFIFKDDIERQVLRLGAQFNRFGDAQLDSVTGPHAIAGAHAGPVNGNVSIGDEILQTTARQILVPCLQKNIKTEGGLCLFYGMHLGDGGCHRSDRAVAGVSRQPPLALALDSSSASDSLTRE